VIVAFDPEFGSDWVVVRVFSVSDPHVFFPELFVIKFSEIGPVVGVNAFPFQSEELPDVFRGVVVDFVSPRL
jgi:hypothetical protein